MQWVVLHRCLEPQLPADLNTYDTACRQGEVHHATRTLLDHNVFEDLVGASNLVFGHLDQATSRCFKSVSCHNSDLTLR